MAVGLALALPVAGQALERNGFRLDGAAIEVGEILPGGPPRDGIPALDAPDVASAAEARWDDQTLVLGVVWNGEARAYPVPILDWHELVNDSLGGRPILVSYCPLCGTGMVFDRRVEGRARRFGVSGLLYRSDVLMFDRETESLWSQILGRAVTGPRRGTRLLLIPSRMDRLGAWRRAHPETRVLTRKTGHRRDYDHSPYAGYAASDRLLFPVRRDGRYPPKTLTLGLRQPDGRTRAYPAPEVLRAGGEVREQVGQGAIRVRYHADRGVFDAEAPDGVDVVQAYWFAWAAFHPDTSVFSGPPNAEGRDVPRKP